MKKMKYISLIVSACLMFGASAGLTLSFLPFF